MQLSDDSVTFKGTAATAWEKLVDWRNMPEWDPFMESVHFDGPLHARSVGRLKMKNGPDVELRVTEFTPGVSYTDEFTLWGSRFVFYHEVKETSAGLVTMRIRTEAYGLLASLLGGVMRKNFSRDMPGLMENFRTQYERRYSAPETPH